MKERYPEFNIFGPGSLEELTVGISGFAGTIAFLAGGTDLLIELKRNLKRPDLVVDLSQIPELNGVWREQGSLRIGSMTTFSRLAKDPLVLEKALCLAQAAGNVGSVQIRNRATLGGNIASASPAGDSLPALLALEAQVTTLAPEGARKLPIGRLLTGKGQTCLGTREVISEIEIPWGTDNLLSSFAKIGSRTAVSIARLNMAVVHKVEGSGQMIKDIRIAVGALGSTAFRLRAVEQALEGRKLGQPFLRLFEKMLVETVDQSIAGRSSHPYKREAIRGLVHSLAANLWGDELIWGGKPND